jgi:uncharacterized membrane protein
MGSRPRSTERTLGLSAGVFAIALTLLVFSIHLPRLAAGHEHELASALLDHRGELLTWLVSFGVIGFLCLVKEKAVQIHLTRPRSASRYV